MTTAQVALPPKLIPVFSGQADVRGAYGGRGSGKTRSFAKMSAVYGYRYGMHGVSGQILCARQFMNSLDDSSLEECKRAISEEAFLADYYEVGEKYIKSKDGLIWFSFAGLDRNVASVKSKGRILLCWVDEAEPVTESAWQILEPTLREESDDWNAELWVTWNPARKSAAVERRYRFSKDPLIKVVEINWRDNPRFPKKLERQRQRDYAERPDTYAHIWEGAYGAIEGSILAKLIDLAELQGRVSDDIDFDPNGAPIEISCDLGRRDTATWWFWQPRLGGYHIVDYDCGTGLDAEEWCERLNMRLGKYKLSGNGDALGHIWMPHDAKAKTFAAKRTAEQTFAAAFGWDKIRSVRKTSIADRVTAARQLTPKVAFNRTACDSPTEGREQSGLDGLRAWRYEWDDDAQVFSSEPLHDWSSHDGDGYSYGCQVMQEVAPPPPPPPEPKFETGLTINEIIRRRTVARLGE